MSSRDLRPKPGFKVFHGVSELGIGSFLARTRPRLIAATTLVTAGFIGYAVGTAAFMRAGSGSVGLNVFLISGAMLLVLVAAFVQALLAGDLLFPGDWRERVILGRRPEIEDEDPLLETIGKFQDFSLAFYLMVAVLLLGNYLLYGIVTGGFLGEYHDWGYQHTLLRSADSEAQVRGIRNVVNPRNLAAQEVEPVRDQIVELAAHGDDEVRGWAMWAISELTIYEAAPTLRELVADESLSDSVRARAAEALGRLADRQGAELMAELLGRSFGREELAMGLLRGLGLARNEATARAIAPLRNVDLYAVRGHAYWALGRTGNRAYRDQLVDTLEHGTVEERCLAAEGLKFLVNEDDLVDTHVWYSSAALDECEPVVWELPYHWHDDRHFRMDIVVDETIAAKCLKLIFASGGARERDFLATIALDEEQPDELRALARELTLRIDHRQ